MLNYSNYSAKLLKYSSISYKMTPQLGYHVPSVDVQHCHLCLLFDFYCNFRKLLDVTYFTRSHLICHYCTIRTPWCQKLVWYDTVLLIYTVITITWSKWTTNIAWGSRHGWMLGCCTFTLYDDDAYICVLCALTLYLSLHAQYLNVDNT